MGKFNRETPTKWISKPSETRQKDMKYYRQEEYQEKWSFMGAGGRSTERYKFLVTLNKMKFRSSVTVKHMQGISLAWLSHQHKIKVHHTIRRAETSGGPGESGSAIFTN